VVDHGPVLENTVKPLVNHISFLDYPTYFKRIIAQYAFLVFQTNKRALVQIILQTVVVKQILKLIRLQTLRINIHNFNQVFKNNIDAKPLILYNGLAHCDRRNGHA
jgi:hypothetical protein